MTLCFTSQIYFTFIAFVSSQGDAGENGPKGDTGEKVWFYEIRKSMCVNKKCCFFFIKMRNLQRSD